MMNASRMCVLVNPAACELLEFTLNEIRPLKANHMSSSAQQYDRIIGRNWLQDAVEKGASRIAWHYRSKSGRVIPTDALAMRVELAQGPAVMVQFRDIEREQLFLQLEPAHARHPDIDDQHGRLGRVVLGEERRGIPRRSSCGAVNTGVLSDAAPLQARSLDERCGGTL
jgi:hypothetical protein